MKQNTVKTESQTYRLGSNPMVCATGLVRFAQAMFKSRSKRDKDKAREIVACWPIPPAAVEAVLAGNCTFDDAAEVVIVTI